MKSDTTVTKHTPGPWATTKYSLNFGRVISPESHVNRPFGASANPERCREHYMAAIAHVGKHDCHFTPEEAEANARLIAAAPELLRELKHLVRLLEPALNGGVSVPGLATVNSAWLAIAKAEGRHV